MSIADIFNFIVHGDLLAGAVYFAIFVGVLIVVGVAFAILEMAVEELEKAKLRARAYFKKEQDNKNEK